MRETYKDLLRLSKAVAHMELDFKFHNGKIYVGE
jgi:hypothetical protein